MKILTVCDQGNNRSVMFAHLLKYWGHDCIPVGLATNSPETLEMLYNWADKIICTESIQVSTNMLPEKVVVFDVGPDVYKRPFNPELHDLVKRFLEENKEWLKP